MTDLTSSKLKFLFIKGHCSEQTREGLGKYICNSETNEGLACKTYKELLQINKKMVNHFFLKKKDKIYNQTPYKRGNLQTLTSIKMRFITSINLTSDQRKIAHH